MTQDTCAVEIRRPSPRFPRFSQIREWMAPRLSPVLMALGLCVFTGVCLADNDISIVVGEKPHVVERFAAEELQGYLEKITGQRAPIAARKAEGKVNLVIGAAEESPGLGSDGFILRTVGNDLHFLGSGPRGRLYAVYEFIEKYLGVRWYGGDVSDEIIPHRPMEDVVAIIQKGIHDQQSPSFSFRETSLGIGGPTPISTLGKLRVNAVMTGYALSDAFRKTTLPELQKRGIDLVIGGHDTYFRFLPPEKYFTDHPEWSILRKGQRVGADRLNGCATFCVTNPQARATFLENLTAYVKQIPEAKYLYPWPSDAAKWCECETCSRQSIGDRFLALDIAIAEALQKVRPDMTVIHFPYGSHMEIPQGLRPPRQMAISLSTWGRNFAYAMDDERTDKKFRDALAGWSRICSETGCLLYIHSKFLRLFGNGFVLMPYAVAPRDIKLYKKLGVDGFDFHRAGYGWWTKTLNDAVILKLVWNCDADPNAIVDDYFATYWAPIGKEVKRIFLSVEKALPDRRYWGMNVNPNLFHTNIEENPLYTPRILRADTSISKALLEHTEKYNINSITVLRDSLDCIRRLLSEARDPILVKRLRKLQTAFEYVLLQREAIGLFLDLRRCATLSALSASENLRQLDQCEAKLAEVHAVEKKIESMCTAANRADGVLWDNGQTRLDVLDGWRQKISHLKEILQSDLKVEKDILWQIGRFYATFDDDLKGGADAPAHVRFKVPPDWKPGDDLSAFPHRHNEPSKKSACRLDIVFQAAPGKYLLTVAHGTSAKPDTVHVLLDGVQVGQYTTQDKERSVRTDIPLEIKAGGEHTITLGEPNEDGGGYELDAIRLIRLRSETEHRP